MLAFMSLAVTGCGTNKSIENNPNIDKVCADKIMKDAKLKPAVTVKGKRRQIRAANRKTEQQCLINPSKATK